MARSCIELWTNVNFVLKMIVLGILLGMHFFALDSYTKFYRFYAFGNGHIFTALINIVILLYAYAWFDTSLVWESCMIISTIIMLIVSTLAFIYDYYDEGEHMILLSINKYLGYNSKSFVISVGSTTMSIVILVIDLVLVILQARGKISIGGRKTQQNRPDPPEE